MIRQLGRSYLFSMAVPCLAILIVWNAMPAVAQTTSLDNTAGPIAGRPRSNSLRAGALAASTPLFPARGSYDTGGRYAWGVAVADLNADGNPDVVVSNFNSGTVSVLLGNGHGWFGPPLIYYGAPGRGGPAAVAVGDVNGDGIPDIVAADYWVGQDCGLGILLGNGDGTFRTTFLPHVRGVTSIVIADLNADGKLDVALAFGPVGVLLGNGDGTFQPQVTYSWGSGGGVGWGSNLAVTDVNGDGKPDLVVATGNSNYPYGTGTLAVLLGNGDGTFQTAVTYTSGGSYANTLATGDVNGDGMPDIIAGNRCIASPCGTVSVLLGNGDGTFRFPVPYSPGGAQPYSVSVADLDGDGKRDLVVTNMYACSNCTYGNLGVLFGNGDGTFQPAVAYGVGGYPAEAAVADVNSDGRTDVVVTTSAKVAVLLTKTGVTTKTTLITSAASALVGQPVTFTATVTPSHGVIPDAEPIAFYDGLSFLGSASLVGGTAVYTTSSLAAGAGTIKATYIGDPTFRLGSGSVSQTVLKYPTTITLSSSPNPSAYGQAVTFTATVTSTGPMPAGKVWFKDETTGMGIVVLTNGVATITRSKLAAGTHSITAQYLGDAYSAKSTSSVLNQVVQ